MFVVVQTKAIPDHVRGYTDRFLSEITSSLYVGTVSKKVADGLWEVLVEHCGEGGVAMVLSTSAQEQGFEVRVEGSQLASIQDFDGLYLPAFRRKIASHAH